MPYKTVRLKDRIIFVPDEELKKRLRQKIKEARIFFWFPVRSPISCFKRKITLKYFLKRHYSGRFFVIIDFVYAFHQITRQMMAKFFNHINNQFWDECFVELGGKQVLPIGFPSSSFLFEAIMNQAIDRRLIEWAEENRGVVTRYADNILITWKKNPFGPFRDLLDIFRGFNVRWTPKEPRKWNNQTSIRFCGLTLCKDGRVGLSQRTKKRLSHKAGMKYQMGQEKSARGIDQFIKVNSY